MNNEPKKTIEVKEEEPTIVEEPKAEIKTEGKIELTIGEAPPPASPADELEVDYNLVNVVEKVSNGEEEEDEDEE